jgi:hypothetical protein
MKLVGRGLDVNALDRTRCSDGIQIATNESKRHSHSLLDQDSGRVVTFTVGEHYSAAFAPFLVGATVRSAARSRHRSGHSGITPSRSGQNGTPPNRDASKRNPTLQDIAIVSWSR